VPPPRPRPKTTSGPQRLWAQVRRLARRYRRWFGAGLVGVSLFLTLSVLAPPPTPTALVAVASQDLTPGTVLSAETIEALAVHTDAVQPTALQPHDAVGRVVSGPVAAGEHLTSTRLRGEALLLGAPPGMLALPVRVTDPGSAALVTSGDRIDLLAAVRRDQGTTVRTVARDVAVLLAPRSPSTGEADADLLGALEAEADLLGGLIVVAASPADVASIVAGAAEAPLWVAVRHAR
jgi:pilus assembly protein CpaB